MSNITSQNGAESTPVSPYTGTRSEIVSKSAGSANAQPHTNQPKSREQHHNHNHHQQQQHLQLQQEIIDPEEAVAMARKAKQHKKWNRRLKVFFCCLGYKKNKDSIADVASIFAEFYADLNVPSSDVAAGFVLLSKYQAAQRQWIVDNHLFEIDQYQSSIPITTSTNFLDISTAEDSHLINDLIYYMNYSLAIFGWPMQVVDDPCMLCCIFPYLKLCGCCGSSSSRTKRRGKRHDKVAAIESKKELKEKKNKFKKSNEEEAIGNDDNKKLEKKSQEKRLSTSSSLENSSAQRKQVSNLSLDNHKTDTVALNEEQIRRSSQASNIDHKLSTPKTASNHPTTTPAASANSKPPSALPIQQQPPASRKHGVLADDCDVPIILDDNCCGCNVASVERRLAAHNYEIIYVTYRVNVNIVPFLVIADHSKQTIVVAMRGSMSLSDMVTDMNGQADKLPIDNCPDNWLSHRGITRAASYVLTTLKNEQILHRAFNCRPDLNSQEYNLVLCGHSLGAGVAAILGILMRKEYPTLKAYLYSPPGGILSLPVVEYTKEFAVGIILGNDCVPRLGIAQLERLRYHVLLSVKSSEQSTSKILAKAICPTCCLGGNKVEYDPNESLNLLHGVQGRSFDYNGNKITFQNQPQVLYVPGRLIHIVKNYNFKTTRRFFNEPIYQAIWNENTSYDRILISEGMLFDHLPNHLMHAMKMLFSKTLPGRKDSKASTAVPSSPHHNSIYQDENNNNNNNGNSFYTKVQSENNFEKEQITTEDNYSHDSIPEAYLNNKVSVASVEQITGSNIINVIENIDNKQQQQQQDGSDENNNNNDKNSIMINQDDINVPIVKQISSSQKQQQLHKPEVGEKVLKGQESENNYKGVC